MHRVKDQIRRLTLPPHALADTAATKEAMVEESMFEYHLYTLERPTTIAEQQTKQVALLSAGEVPVNKEYVLQGKDYYYRGRHGDLGRSSLARIASITRPKTKRFVSNWAMPLTSQRKKNKRISKN